LTFQLRNGKYWQISKICSAISRTVFVVLLAIVAYFRIPYDFIALVFRSIPSLHAGGT
jgi:hypothetical protein